MPTVKTEKGKKKAVQSTIHFIYEIIQLNEKTKNLNTIKINNFQHCIYTIEMCKTIKRKYEKNYIQ